MIKIYHGRGPGWSKHPLILGCAFDTAESHMDERLGHFSTAVANWWTWLNNSWLMFCTLWEFLKRCTTAAPHSSFTRTRPNWPAWDLLQEDTGFQLLLCRVEFVSLTDLRRTRVNEKTKKTKTSGLLITYIKILNYIIIHFFFLKDAERFITVKYKTTCVIFWGQIARERHREHCDTAAKVTSNIYSGSCICICYYQRMAVMLEHQWPLKRKTLLICQPWISAAPPPPLTLKSFHAWSYVL